MGARRPGRGLVGESGRPKRSGNLVRGHGIRVLTIAGLGNTTVALLGPVVGVAMMFITPASLSVINFGASLVYVFVMPAAGIILGVLFFDLRIAKDGEHTPPRPRRTRRQRVSQAPGRPARRLDSRRESRFRPSSRSQ